MNNDRFILKAWDKTKKEISAVQEIVYAVFDGKPIYIKLQNGSEFKLGNINEVILLQSTGLKDKNGKLIFEGNLVHIEEKDYHDRTKIGKEFATYETKAVEFDHGTFLFDGIPLADLLNNPYLIGEIVGSFYTTPELLSNNNLKNE